MGFSCVSWDFSSKFIVTNLWDHIEDLKSSTKSGRSLVAAAYRNIDDNITFECCHPKDIYTSKIGFLTVWLLFFSHFSCLAMYPRHLINMAWLWLYDSHWWSPDPRNFISVQWNFIKGFRRIFQWVLLFVLCTVGFISLLDGRKYTNEMSQNEEKISA